LRRLGRVWEAKLPQPGHQSFPMSADRIDEAVTENPFGERPPSLNALRRVYSVTDTLIEVVYSLIGGPLGEVLIWLA